MDPVQDSDIPGGISANEGVRESRPVAFRGAGRDLKVFALHRDVGVQALGQIGVQRDLADILRKNGAMLSAFENSLECCPLIPTQYALEYRVGISRQRYSR